MQKKKMLAMLLALSVTCSMAVTPVYAVCEPGPCTPGAEATCTTAQTCTECGAEITPATGHTPGAAATCTTAQTCTECGAEITPATGHTPGEAATCTTAQKCTVCDAEITPATGHTPGEAATCTTAQKCTVCDTELSPARGHNLPSEWTKFENNHVKQCRVPTCDYEIKEAHADETGDDGLCDECGYEIGHTHVAAADSSWLNGIYEGKMFHYHACTVENCDSMAADKEFCTFVDGKCTVCGVADPNYTPSKPSSSGSSSSSSSSVNTKEEVKAIENADKGEKVEVEISGNTVPAEYVQAALTSGATIVVDYGAYEWEITDVKSVKAVDLSIDTNASYIVEQSALKALPGDSSNVIDIAHDGALDFKATLKYDVDKKNASKYVNLYYYEPTAKKLELQGSSKIGLDGYVYLPFTHCSTYVLNITATPASSNMFEDLAAGESATVVEETLPATDNAPATTNAPVVTTAATDAAANPETGNSALALLAIPAVIAAAAVVAKKRG